MSFRCYWCDGDRFLGVNSQGEQVELEIMEKAGETPKDYVCAWCEHLVSEGNPRQGDPKETVESLKEERDEIRAQLEQCQAMALGLAGEPEGPAQ